MSSPAELQAAKPLSPEEYVDVLARTGLGLVCKLDRAGRILTFDDACERVTGYTAAEVIGRDARDTVIPPEERRAFGIFLEQFGDIASSPQVGHWLTKDGERRQIAWSNRPIFDDEGNSVAILTVGLDLTERDRSAAQVEALHSALEDRLAEVEVLAVEQAALRRVATLVAGEADASLVFDAVAVETAKLARSRTAAVVRYGDEACATVVGRWSCAAEEELFPVGSVVPLGDDTAAGIVYRTGAAARVDAYGDGVVAARMRDAGYVSAAAAPVMVAGRPWGAVIVSSGANESLGETVERRLAPFAALLALAVASADAREQVIASRARLVAASDEVRRRLERDLHDGAQQRLVTLVLGIGVARRKVEDEAVGELLAAAERDAREAIAELRHLATGLHPPILTEGGLAPALAALARRTPLEVELVQVPEERFEPTIEVAAYFVVTEALTNVVKHAEATSVRVSARREKHTLVVTVSDDGQGGANPQGGTGLVGLTDRVEALRGTLSISSSWTAGTLLRADFPLPA